MTNKNILVLGAGVIGFISAGHSTKTGHNATILARNKRFEELLNKGLLLKSIIYALSKHTM